MLAAAVIVAMLTDVTLVLPATTISIRSMETTPDRTMLAAAVVIEGVVSQCPATDHLAGRPASLSTVSTAMVVVGLVAEADTTTVADEVSTREPVVQAAMILHTSTMETVTSVQYVATLPRLNLAASIRAQHLRLHHVFPNFLHTS